MEIGKRIRLLRSKCSLTQEQLADRLGVSAQAVSKWENAVTMPDITLLPELAGVFGVSIDELFDLTTEQKLRRIESRMDLEEELEPDVFREYEEFLQERLEAGGDRRRALSLLAHLYHHRLTACARKCSRYARESILLAPEKKDCQWLLDRAEGQYTWDWNVSQHSRVIDFYKELIADGSAGARSPLPYCYLLDNLIADHRTEEAKRYLAEYRALPASKEFLADVYAAHIALADYDEAAADAIIAEGMTKYAGDGGFLFEAAQYHARNCEYEEAIACYEAADAAEEEEKPRFTDALEGIALICEITGEYEKAAAVYDRILCNLRAEGGFTEDTVVEDTRQKRDRLLAKK
jgi:transcriptional regulator with XRE-family HTH domain